MSKSFIYNLILTIVAIVVFIFIGASVYDAFTRTPVNRTASDGSASSVSGQIEAATPDATQPSQPTAAGDSTSATQDRQQAASAYDQTNDPAAQANSAQGNAGSAETPASDSGTPTTSTATPATSTSGVAPAAPASASPSPQTGATPQASAGSTSNAPSASNSVNQPVTPSDNEFGAAKPAVRTNPDLRAVIPPVPTAPPRAEGAAPPNTSSQDMFNATNSSDESISDSFPAPVSNFPAPVTPGASNNPAPANNNEQQRLQELRNQKEQLRRDLGF